MNEQAAVPNQVIPRKALKSASKGAFESSKKKVSFGPLEESFTNSEKYVSCINDEVLAGLRFKYHIPDVVKLRTPTADEKPHHVHSNEVAIYLEAISVGFRFSVHLFFHKVLHSLHVAPIQLNPNVY